MWVLLPVAVVVAVVVVASGVGSRGVGDGGRGGVAASFSAARRRSFWASRELPVLPSQLKLIPYCLPSWVRRSTARLCQRYVFPVWEGFGGVALPLSEPCCSWAEMAERGDKQVGFTYGWLELWRRRWT